MSITQVTTDGISDDALTAAKIAAGAVGTTEIADDAITVAKIAAGAVGTTEIASGVSITGTLNGNAATVTNGVYTTNFIGSNQDIVGTNGYQKLPGGLIIQWGRTGNIDGINGFEDITFPISFTASVFSVVATPVIINPPAGDKSDMWGCISQTLTGFRMRSVMENRNATYTWIAIGV
jgi:hypothetical protein